MRKPAHQQVAWPQALRNAALIAGMLSVMGELQHRANRGLSPHKGLFIPQPFEQAGHWLQAGPILIMSRLHHMRL